jgi:hypothetical protein
MIAIAYGIDGLPISIVQAHSLRDARIFWHGRGIVPITEEEVEALDAEALVRPLLTTKLSTYDSPVKPSRVLQVVKNT